MCVGLYCVVFQFDILVFIKNLYLLKSKAETELLGLRIFKKLSQNEQRNSERNLVFKKVKN